MLMSRQNKSTAKFKRPSLVLIIATVSFVGMIIMTYVLGTYMYAQSQIEELNATDYFKQVVRINHLETCYENNIRPCNQETINAFYDSEPAE